MQDKIRYLARLPRDTESSLVPQSPDPGSIPYDVSADGQQFVSTAPAAEGAEAPEPLIRIVQNWFAEFRGREQD